jgi:ankyrin repeat protein
MKILEAREFCVSEFSAALSESSAAQVNKAGEDGLTALHIAVLEMNEYACNELLKAGARPNDKDNVQGETALLHSVDQVCNINIVKALLEHGAAVNEPSNQGLTPLYWAVRGGHVDVVKLLLQNGANPYITYRSKIHSPADKALSVMDADMMQTFENAGYNLLLEGSGLWVVSSFLNHDDAPNTNRTRVGNMWFVTAATDMPADTELTTTYGPSGALGHWNL